MEAMAKHSSMDHLTVKEGLPVLYSTYNLEPDGGVNDASVKVELLKGFSLYLPNFETRKKVVVKHDIHHLLTGYSAVMKGETEISAWEISTGCHHNWFAFIINTLGMMAGVPVNLIGIWKAWLRGKYTTNLYSEKYVVDKLMSQNVAEIKKELGLNESFSHRFALSGLISFLGFLLFGTLLSIVFIVLIPFILIYSLYIIITK